jgi:hypothetical protein
MGLRSIAAGASYHPEVGDVIVIQDVKGHPNGHIELYDGKNWVSDFIQQDMWPARAHPPPEITASKLADLAKDAVCRYSQAFGDYRRLMHLVLEQGIKPTAFQAGALKDAIFSPPKGCN